MNSRIFRVYNVWPDFPSISISGTSCYLDCAHCGKRYLEDMEPAASPEALVSLCQVLKTNGARGVLLSGGCDNKGGLLNLERFLPAIRQVHDMGLIIKLHTGFVDDGLAGAIAGAGVDIASQEMVGDSSTIKRIFGIDSTPEDYLATFRRLQDAGIPHICPHVCIGLDQGKLKGEFRALDMLADSIEISTLALIVFRPTKGTRFSDVQAPAGEDVERAAAHARELFPDKNIILGALRPRSPMQERLDIELGALKGGIDGAEVPSHEMLDKVVSMGLDIKKIESFGVLPVDYENRVQVS